MQIEKLELVTKFAPKFCSLCIQTFSSPELIQDCQNKFCEKPTIVEAQLEPDLELFTKLGEKLFKSCKVETALFCQFCRQTSLSGAELRLLNQLLDRRMMGKSVALITSERSKRAKNLGKKLMPRAVAIFPVVFENVSKPNMSNIELCNQHDDEVKKIEQNQKIQPTSKATQNKYRAYDKIEISLRKIIFSKEGTRKFTL